MPDGPKDPTPGSVPEPYSPPRWEIVKGKGEETFSKIMVCIWSPEESMDVAGEDHDGSGFHVLAECASMDDVQEIVEEMVLSGKLLLSEIDRLAFLRKIEYPTIDYEIEITLDPPIVGGVLVEEEELPTTPNRVDL